MDLNKIRQKLDKLSGTQQSRTESSGNLFWKPSPGKQSVRILPNFALSSDPLEQPFVPLDFYYEFGGTLLSLAQFDEDDPIKAFHDELLRKPGERGELWEEAKPFRASQRIYVPILVRGLEGEGVKFWGIGIMVYRKLRALYDDAEWGCIHDLKEGVDITVEFTPSPDRNNPKNAKTEVTPSRKSSPATTDAALLEAIKQMPDITKIFKKPTYDELKTALTRYLNSAEQPVKEPEKPAITSKKNDIDDVSKAFDEVFPSTRQEPSADDLPF